MLFFARLICSDVECAERSDEHVGSLAELGVLACDCGCTWELLAVSQSDESTWVPAPGTALAPFALAA